MQAEIAARVVKSGSIAKFFMAGSEVAAAAALAAAMVGSSNAGQEHRLILGFSVHLSGTHQDCCISAKATGIVRKFTMCILHVSKSTVMGQDGGVREVRGTHVCTLFGFASIDLMDVFPFLVGPKKVKWQHDKQPNEQWNMWH